MLNLIEKDDKSWLFERHINIEDDLFQEAMAIYMQAFPLQERQPEHVIKERVAKGNSELYIGRIQYTVIFIAILFPLHQSDFILLDYMATHADHQGKKVAAGFLSFMQPVLQKANKYFILEVEDPATGNNKSIREKRMAFYRANDAYQLNGVHYLLPALQGNETTDMVLMLFPQYPNNSIPSSIVKKLIIRLYEELYNRSETEALQNSSGYTGKTMITLS